MFCTGLCLIAALGGHHISVKSQSTVVIAPPAIVLLVHVRVALSFRLYSYVLMRVRANSYVFIAYPSQGKKTFVGKINTWLASPTTDVTAVLVHEWHV